MPGGHRPIDLRRALLGHLLTAGDPVTVRGLVDALAGDFGADAEPKRIADMLRYQVRRGRVRRTARGVYQAMPGAFARSTAWRCVNWRRLQPDEVRGVAEP